MTSAALPFFLDLGVRGRRYCIYRAPASKAERCIVYVHPFADEMNKSRRMAATCARALATAGHAVLQIDLLGCGDSDGEISAATWDDWVLDTVAAARWLTQRHEAPLTLWGLRCGALLVTQAAARLEQSASIIFWQPVIRGDTLLQQFLRMRIAAQMQDATVGRESTDQLRTLLESGRSVDVAGYRLAPDLARGLSSAELVPPPQSCSAFWLELSARPEPALPPASIATIERWRSAGHHVEPVTLSGPPFWSTVEIEMAPSLVEATVSALATEGRPTN